MLFWAPSARPCSQARNRASLSDAELARLHGAMRWVLESWTDKLRKESKGGFPDKLTAFHPEMAVHGRFGQPSVRHRVRRYGRQCAEFGLFTMAVPQTLGGDGFSNVEILEEYDMYPENIRLENREGGSGATGWGYLLNQRGSGYGISTTSGSFITTPLQADTGWTYEDFTPVGLFATDDAIFVVPGDSEFQTWEDWVDYATAQESVVVGVLRYVRAEIIRDGLDGLEHVEVLLRARGVDPEALAVPQARPRRFRQNRARSGAPGM